MKKHALIVAMFLGMTVTIWAQGFPVSPQGEGDTRQPIGPVSDDPAGLIQPGPGVTAAVPEPSTISLLAGGAILSSWFFLRRRR